MLKYIIKRLIVMIPIVLAISIVGFIGANITSDPVTAYFSGRDARSSREPTAAEIEQAKKALGLDQPMMVRYFKWFARIVRGDLGYTATGKLIIDEITARLPVSLTLGISSIIIGIFGGILLGVLCARHQYSWFDYAVGAINYLMQSLPSLLTAILLVILFCQKLNWLPTFGYNSPNLVNPTPWETFLDHARHMLIPILCASLPSVGGWARLQRAAYLEVMRSDYVRTARSKGLDENRVAFRHVLRNALLPIANMTGSIVMGAIGGSYIIETLFSLPGIGSLTTGALLSFDYNLILSTSLLTTIMGTVGLLISDITIAIVDPRIRYE
jgi:peptide/nickel transport system permease protein